VDVLRRLFRHRRLLAGAGACADRPCVQCLALHQPRIQRFLAANAPIHFLLPAFPARSANPRKVLSPLPDMGEELALRFLQSVCDEVRELYPPGARITICSDGRVFNDLVGVRDEDVTAYQRDIAALIRAVPAPALDLFDLDDVFAEPDFAAVRHRLCRDHAEPLEVVVSRVRNFDLHRQQFNGIHRFLFEDLVVRSPGASRTQVRNHSKELAYQVIRRSQAWSRLIAQRFPDALRLSIHPQHPHAEKIGILLTPAEDNWLTPWHGVAVRAGDRFTLMWRSQAEDLGARPIYCDGRPSHYEMPPSAPAPSRQAAEMIPAAALRR
jgi:pyoverdine/dityrosine biosynthesis protein Dit1